MEAPIELKYRVEDRPEDAEASKRDTRDKIKVRRQTSDSIDEHDEQPSLEKDLSKELENAAAPDPLIMAYLQSMMTAALAAPMYNAYAAAGAGFTTVMLRNIPNRYTRDMLVARLDKGYKNLYDFVYLPIDFSSKCNVGYAFINFRTPSAAHRFHNEFHMTKTKQCLPGFSSSKVAEVSFARVQGRDQNMENLRDEKFMEKLHDRTDWQPLFLDEHGKEIPFSKAFGGDKKRSKKPVMPAAAPTFIPPTTPTGYMRPPPSFPSVNMFPPSFAVPPAPATTLASILPSASAETLLMLKGVPATYARDQLVEKLKSKYGAAFDFLFLPNDTKSEGNRGHAFINFSKSDTAKTFQEDFAGKPMKDVFDGTEDDKVCEVVAARMESLEKTIQRCQSRKEAEAESPWLPLLFGDDGEAKPCPSLSAPHAGAKEEAEPKAKAKQKDRRQGSKDSTPTAAPRGYPYPGYYGYGGYPPYPGYNPAVYAYAQLAAAQNAQAIQVAQLQAQASARAHAGKGGTKSGIVPSILDPLAAAVNHKEDEELTEDHKAQLRHQVEYYFSTDNLCKDLFLREHMERDGWVSLNLIRTFPRVSKFSVSSKKLMEACSGSQKLEIDDSAEKIRLANADERSKWANTPVPPDYKKRSA
ncbi:ML4 [Symbiodinium natans]|uniref:ML4 protein n=1 Tax=Symbiodinium natans TaxID=878477 RepID=A0A812M222_9DINO|nr:ML4 [Symbiodinium natans]